MSDYPNFTREVTAMGDTNVERAAKLNTSTKTIERYIDGDVPEYAVRLALHPNLLIALLCDIHRLTPDDVIRLLTADKKVLT